MNRDDYRAAFDGIQFRESFQRDTVNKLLHEAGRQHEKERTVMKFSLKKTSLLAAVLALALVVSAAAAVIYLRPSQVANEAGNAALAAAFESNNALILDQTQESGNYRFTLSGLVSGAGLSGFYDDADTSRSYVVAAVSRTDGKAMTDEEASNLTITPLVKGQTPWEVNAWTLDGGYTRFIRDGVCYYLYEYNCLEMFADHTIYLAAYEGFVPSSEMFKVGQDGSIAFQDSFTAPHALFTLPLDASKADPAAVSAFLAKLHEPSPEDPDTEELDPNDPNDPNAEFFEITPEMIDEAIENNGGVLEVNP